MPMIIHRIVGMAEPVDIEELLATFDNEELL